MSPSPFVEETQVVAQAEPDVPRYELVAVLLGVSSFLVVLAVGLALYLAKFQVETAIINAGLTILVAGAVVGLFRIRPASQLTPTERMIRSKRNVYLVLGTMTGAAVLGSIATASELDSLGDWLMLAFIASSPIGIFVLARARFTIGSG